MNKTELDCHESDCVNDGFCYPQTVTSILYEPHKLNDPSQPYFFHLGNCGFMPHWHENIEILYFHGDTSVICDRKEYSVSANDMVIIGSNSLHASSKNCDTKHDCLIIDGAFLARSGIDVSSLRFECVVHDERLSELFCRVEKEIRLFEDGDAFGTASVMAAILTLSVELCRKYSRKAENDKARGSVVKRAIGYIKSHYDKPLGVEHIAEAVNVSKYYFCREFHSETGYTVVKYINNLRCREAERLLFANNYSVSEIARMCGFENMSYFTRTYKSIIGKTPTQTRIEGRGRQGK